MGMGGQCHAPGALPPGKRPSIQHTGGWVSPRASQDGGGKFHPPVGFDPPPVQPIASHYRNYAIPAHLLPCHAFS